MQGALGMLSLVFLLARTFCPLTLFALLALFALASLAITLLTLALSGKGRP